MINLNNLGFKYGKKSTVFSGLSLSIPQGRSVGVLGANGVGKTTLIKLIAGLVSQTDGDLSVLGFTPRDRETDFYKNLYVVPEESELPPMKAAHYVDQFSVFYPQFDHQRFHDLAGHFKTDVQKKLNEMSLGQKKKFIIAFAMSTGCQLVLMDEPTNGLDIPAKAQFRDIVVKHQSDEQTFLICTHQVRDLDSIIDSVVMMNDQHAHWFDLSQLPDKISQVNTVTNPEAVLYSETRMGTELAIIEGGLPQATDIDLEMLFNTFHTNYEGLIAAVNKEANL
jgi:ABC-2 type transport system ATP-binding protein